MPDDRARVAIAGVGNCAAALVQAVAHYAVAATDGAITPWIGPMRADAIQFVAAFDVDERKIGTPLAKAIHAPPNCCRVGTRTASWETLIAATGAFDVPVHMGPVLDGIAPHMADYPAHRSPRPASVAPVDVAQVLKESGAEVLVNYMPVGAERAARFYAAAALDAGCGFVNAMPCFIASEGDWAARFAAKCLPIIGDDVKSQFGATHLHRALVAAMVDRGIRLTRTYQLNTGGNTDFLNMLDRTRLASKKRSKTDAVKAAMHPVIAPENVHIGPSDYVPWLDDNKVAFLRLEAEGCAGAPMDVEIRLSVQDSPNSAGVVMDAVRYVAMALRAGIGGTLHGPSAWLMKSPPMQLADGVALAICRVAASGNLNALTMVGP
ncbi:MAG TPA: inositol-3-phosphate synthase [Acetobacteraceae bacterium]